VGALRLHWRILRRRRRPLRASSEPIPKVVESRESLVIHCLAPESHARGAECGSLNIAALPIAADCAIRVT
jgi:hypothetical protein